MPLDRSIYSEESWEIVRSYKEFVETVRLKFYLKEWPSLISFDHDLADEHYDPAMYSENGEYPKNFSEKTGTECAKWLLQFCIENDIELPDYTVHSMNPIGAERIKGVLEGWRKYKEFKETGKI